MALCLSRMKLPFERCVLACCHLLCLPPHTGSIEYAIAEDRMTDDGDLWVPLEEDVTLKRYSSCTFGDW